jgi:hypothetical protein
MPGEGGAGGSAGSGPEGDTWETFAAAFFEDYCVSCHNQDNTGTASRDYLIADNVEAEAETIACGVAKSTEVWGARGCSGTPVARQFPAGSGPEPSDDERDRLLAWIDAGMP